MLGFGDDCSVECSKVFFEESVLHREWEWPAYDGRVVGVPSSSYRSGGVCANFSSFTLYHQGSPEEVFVRSGLSDVVGYANCVSYDARLRAGNRLDTTYPSKERSSLILYRLHPSYGFLAGVFEAVGVVGAIRFEMRGPVDGRGVQGPFVTVSSSRERLVLDEALETYMRIFGMCVGK